MSSYGSLSSLGSHLSTMSDVDKRTGGTCSCDPSTNNGRRQKMIQMIIVPCLPIVILLVQCCLSVIEITDHYKADNDLTDIVKEATAVSSAIFSLQEERRISLRVACVGIGELGYVWANSDARLERVPHTTTEIFQRLSKIRRSIYKKENRCSFGATVPYTDLLNEYIQLLPPYLDTHTHSEIRNDWVAFVSLINGHEARYLEDVIGSAYFKNEHLPQEDLVAFVGFREIGDIKLKYVNKHLIEKPSKYRTPNETLIDSFAEIVVESSLKSSDNTTYNYHTWYETYSAIHGDFVTLQDNFINCLTLCRDNHGTEIALISFNAVIMCIAVFVTLFIMQNAVATNASIHNIVEVFYSRAIELKKERRKTQLILRQMLPKSIAKQLERGEAIHAKEFDLATIFFSDMVDFSDIAQKSEPLQIVNTLNTIYNLLDNRIECYDVYKVETVGSTYMVVSGVPVRNDKQVFEIASMALDIRERCNELKIEHLEKRPVQLRIGINTGKYIYVIV